MADRRLCNPKEGTLLDRDLAGHASVPVKDIFSPPHRPLVQRANDSDTKFAPRFPRQSQDKSNVD